jgi:zinc transport system ATP-binding protein
MNDTIVFLEGVSVYLDGILVLKDIEFEIYRNDFLGIIGPNGGGKTTLLKVILGLIKPDTGVVEVFGKSPVDARSEVGYVPQYAHFDRNFPISVLDVVLMGLNGIKGFLGRYSKEDREKSLEALETMEMLDYKDKQIGSLSGGQIQRVFIARALVSQPELLLLDEPTTSVDKRIETEVYDILEELRENIAIVMVSHDMVVLSKHVSRIACLNRELYVHDSREITKDMLEKTYKCPVDLIAHGIPHRVLEDHTDD